MIKPPFNKFPTLYTERLILREIKLFDSEDAQAITFYDGKPAATLEETAEILERIKKDYEKGESIHWGIALKENNKIIGSCGFYRGFSDNSSEIGYIIKEENRGAGIITEASKSIVIFGFNVLKLSKIIAYTESSNPASQKVLVKMGFEEVESEKPGMIKYSLNNFLSRR